MPVAVMMLFESYHGAFGVTILLMLMAIGFLGGACTHASSRDDAF